MPSINSAEIGSSTAKGLSLTAGDGPVSPSGNVVVGVVVSMVVLVFSTDSP
jgi:hypothetical protein